MKRIIIAVLLLITLLSVPFGAYARNQLPVLMYHNVCEDYSLVESNPTVHITRERIDEHFAALKENGFTAISLDDYYNYRTKGGKLPENPVLITFDDGYTSNYTYAYPMLKKYGLKAVIFVIAARMGADNVQFPHFSWSEAREMEKSGYVEIESHSFTHPDFSNLSYADTALQMRLAKFAIESNMSKKCRFFAYPYGKTNNMSYDMAKRAGYEAVMIIEDRTAAADTVDMLSIPRHTVLGTWTADELLARIR